MYMHHEVEMQMTYATRQNAFDIIMDGRIYGYVYILGKDSVLCKMQCVLISLLQAGTKFQKEECLVSLLLILHECYRQAFTSFASLALGIVYTVMPFT